MRRMNSNDEFAIRIRSISGGAEKSLVLSVDCQDANCQKLTL